MNKGYYLPQWGYIRDPFAAVYTQGRAFVMILEDLQEGFGLEGYGYILSLRRRSQSRSGNIDRADIEESVLEGGRACC